MSIRFVCPACGRKLRAGNEMAGKRVRCTRCSHVGIVPVPAAAPSPAAEPAHRRRHRFIHDPETPPPRGPRLSRATMFAGMAATNCTFLLLLGLVRLLHFPEDLYEKWAELFGNSEILSRFRTGFASELRSEVVCLVVAALVGGYFAAAIADRAKLLQCFIASFYILILQLALCQCVIAGQAIEATRSTPNVNLMAVYEEALRNFYTSRQVMIVAGAYLAAFLVGAIVERVSMAMARAIRSPEHWTYKTTAGQRIDARGSWRHPLLAGLWWLAGWLFTLNCWVPFLLEDSWVRKVLGCASMLVLGQLCRLLAKKRTAGAARRALRENTEPPVVYLRSFQDDGRKSREGAWHFYTRGVFALLIGTVEERLARTMRRFGPFVAIGKPGEELPEMGAARMYVEDDDWQAVVSDLLNRRDALAVLQAGETQGLRWEENNLA